MRRSKGDARLAAADAPDAGPVLVVDLAKRFGGADVRVLALAQALRGLPVVVAALSGSPLDRRLEAAQLPRAPVPYGRADPRVAWHLFRLLRRGGFRAIDAHNPQSQLWSLVAGMAAGIRHRLVTVHSQYRAESGDARRGRWYEAVLRLNRLLGARFIAVGEATDQYLADLGVPSPRRVLIPNAVAPDEQGPDPDARRELLAAWSPDSVLVGVVARLEPVKGVADLLEAMSQVAEGHPRLRCVVIGDGRSRPELERRAAESGLSDRVRFLGFREDVPRLLRGLDALCLPSRSEGLPFALLEAAARDLPLVATTAGGMGKLLEDGRTAWLSPPADPRALAASLRRLVESPEESREVGRRAGAMIRARFSAEAMSAHTAEAYAGRRSGG